MQATVSKHPQTGESLLVFAAQPGVWKSDGVLNLLRMIKQNFPAEFRTVNYEIIQPVNGAKLQIPEDIGGKAEQ